MTGKQNHRSQTCPLPNSVLPNGRVRKNLAVEKEVIPPCPLEKRAGKLSTAVTVRCRMGRQQLWRGWQSTHIQKGEGRISGSLSCAGLRYIVFYGNVGSIANIVLLPWLLEGCCDLSRKFWVSKNIPKVSLHLYWSLHAKELFLHILCRSRLHLGDIFLVWHCQNNGWKIDLSWSSWPTPYRLSINSSSTSIAITAWVNNLQTTSSMQAVS